MVRKQRIPWLLTCESCGLGAHDIAFPFFRRSVTFWHSKTFPVSSELLEDNLFYLVLRTTSRRPVNVVYDLEILGILVPKHTSLSSERVHRNLNCVE